ncbi:hypothetical protein MHH67_13280 [Bacillus sp. FSL K6-0047]
MRSSRKCTADVMVKPIKMILENEENIVMKPQAHSTYHEKVQPGVQNS